MSYRDDLDAAHSRIVVLEDRLDEANARNAELEEELEYGVEEGPGMKEELLSILHTLLIFGGLGISVYALYATHGTPGKCYIEHSFGSHDLVQERNWGMDDEIASFETPQEALQFARELGCPMRYDND